MVRVSRPENSGPPEYWYQGDEAQKYTHGTRIGQVQVEMAERCLQLLALPDETPRLLLDIGCGSGISGDVLHEHGHNWVGMDIAPDMLKAAQERETTGELVHANMGDGVPFRPGSFDGCISVSALQWLCYSNAKSEIPFRRLSILFQTLYSALVPGSRAVFQVYTETEDQLRMMTDAAMRAGFTGGVLVDYPNSSKAKKIYLVLFCGVPLNKVTMPKPLMEGEGLADGYRTEVATSGRDTYVRKRARSRASVSKPIVKSKAWIVNKKRRQALQGEQVRPHSKYTGRRRKNAF
ncbi:uncharacterised protein family, methyltransferase, Williams-Beuren syndrome [Kipferlia bialata]|uniref:Methyltransferase type 11 domain-containing protein n=1 Tax=Kipferlia bialata TaxID=797122 RepID=A0A9K3CMD8_9EUKA|nr:uncharacterised protein family, methyltransferase, Williams-Beuren syndrome [Kipferlia bialata]|eukprot:g467.t1